jgi:DNA-binding protein H-NS
MNNPATLETLGQSAKLLRSELIDRISDASDAKRALDAAIERAKQNLPEFDKYESARRDLVIARNAYDAAAAAYRAEQSIAS